MRKNLGVIRGQYDAVPVRVFDAGELWQYQGSMRAEIEGDIAATVISWEQMTGSPVTYTSSTDGLEITFTTTDLINKVFRCYTNKGTEGERWDEGTFYHNPVEVIIMKSSMVGTQYVNNQFDPSVVTYKADGGIYYGDVVATENAIVRINDPVDAFTELTFYGMPDFAVDDILYTWVMGYTAAGGWVVTQAYEGYVNKVHALPDEYEDYKVVIRHSKFGIISDIVATKSELLSVPVGNGISDRTFHRSSMVGTSSAEYVLQRRSSSTYQDQIPVTMSMVGTSHISYTLQYNIIVG